MVRQQYGKKNGFVTLTAVLVLGLVALITVSGSLLTSNDNFSKNKTLRISIAARHLAESCAEIALNTLKSNVAYTGNENMVLPFGTCSILTISGSGNNNRVLQTRATISNITRELQIDIQTINPNTIITAWQELDI